MANVNNFKMGVSGISALKIAEGYKSVLYNDGPNKNEGHCTIGYGHLVHHNICDSKKYKSEKPFIKGTTKVKAVVVLKKDLVHAENAVNDLVTVQLNQNQYDALVMFVYNIGRSKFVKSTLLKELNKGQFKKVPAQLKRWNKQKGKVVKGLINRRNKEIKIWNKSVDK